jgi:periodic tryptophan protein 2
MEDSEEEIKQNSRSVKVKRNVKVQVRVKSVKFSPDGKQFAVATTEGVLLFSNDTSEIFLPLDIDMDITLDNVIA